VTDASMNAAIRAEALPTHEGTSPPPSGVRVS